ncbi:hypothetical protein [Candidatus Phytoplasma fraxini]|uniref:hypothetical protein n=1 Tax=Ash yellows phytoplasma TaxID=35780 RepID=UPI0030FE565B
MHPIIRVIKTTWRLITKKTVVDKEIKQQDIVIDKTSKFAVLQEEIDNVTEAINYNDAEKEKIRMTVNQKGIESEEIQKLNNYSLFLDSQLLSFNKRLEKLHQDIQNIKENNIELTKKKPTTLSNVYGMEEEK